MSDSLLGQLLADRYEIRAQHAEEMLGRVYLATDRKTGSLVHVKVLHPYLTQNVEKVKRFAREVTATRAVAHPNSVAILDNGQTGENHWLILEYFPTVSLQEIVDKDGPLTPERALHIGAQIAAALAVAHKEGVVHRNLNPGTILLLQNARRGDYVKVRDFGLSRLQSTDDEEDDEDGHALTSVGARIGNTFYMAPEYIEEQLVDPRGDIYALGGIFTFMLTGHPPFTGRPAQVLDKHMTERPKPVSKERDDIPPWLDELILVLLGKNPRKRPSADAIVESIKRNAAMDVSPPPLLAIDVEGNPIPLTPVEQAMEHKGKIAMVAAFAVGLMLVAAVGIGLGIWLVAG